MRNHPLHGVEREQLSITDVRVLPLSYVDPNRDLDTAARHGQAQRSGLGSVVDGSPALSPRTRVEPGRRPRARQLRPPRPAGCRPGSAGPAAQQVEAHQVCLNSERKYL